MLPSFPITHHIAPGNRDAPMPPVPPVATGFRFVGWQ